MGVQLTELIKAREITLDELFDKTIAIDAYNWIYQFLSTIRQRDGEPLKDSQGRVTSHLSGLFYRTIKLLQYNIKPVYVFDGKPPEFKKDEAKRRHDAREEALKEWKEALKKGDYESARKHAQRATKITDEHVKDSKDLLDAMGLPWIQAPSEGEALCSHMTKNGDVYATATQDYDSLLFGCPKLIRNLSIAGRRKKGNDYITINPQIISLSEVLESLGINQDQLIMIGILVGTDFNIGGVSGYGPKKALELVKEKKTLENVFKDVPWEFDISPESIFNFFKNPELCEYDIRFNDLNEEKIKKILCDEHDFSLERISNALEKLKSKSNQKSLSKWI